MTRSKYRVIQPHTSEYPRPITFERGALLEVGEEYVGEEGWDNWFRCTAPGQEAGWVPGQIIERLDGASGRALEDYTARELNVQVGDLVIGIRELNGWAWCERQDGSEAGWVPLDALLRLPQG